MVSTPLKNISQIESSSQLLGKIKNDPKHQLVCIYIYIHHLHPISVTAYQPWTSPGASQSSSDCSQQRPVFCRSKTRPESPETGVPLQKSIVGWVDQPISTSRSRAFYGLNSCGWIPTPHVLSLWTSDDWIGWFSHSEVSSSPHLGWKTIAEYTQ